MRVAIEIQISDPSLGGFRLDRSPLSNPAHRLGAPTPAGFRLDISALSQDNAPGENDGRLGPVEAAVWFDLTPYATTASTTEGQQDDHPAMPPDPGSATIHMLDAPDLDGLGLTVGAALRIRAWTDKADAGPDFMATVWAGWVSGWSTEWEDLPGVKGGRLTTTLEAEDLAAHLGNITRYGVQHTGTETLQSRLTRLAASSPLDLDVDVTDVNNPPARQLSPTVMETNLLAHMAMATLSAQLYLRCRSINQTLYAPRGGTYYIQLVTPTDQRAALNKPSYLSIAMGFGDAATVLELTSHQIGTDGTALDTTTTVINPTAVTVRGRRAAAADISTGPAAAAAIANWALPPHAAKPGPTRLTLRGPDAWIPGYPHVYPAGGYRWLEPLDRIYVYRQGTRHDCLISRVSHTWTLDPTQRGTPAAINHRTTLDLVRNNTNGQ